MHTDIDQFSPIDVFWFHVNETIGDFAFRVFFEPGLGSPLNRVEMKLESSEVFFENKTSTESEWRKKEDACSFILFKAYVFTVITRVKRSERPI